MSRTALLSPHAAEHEASLSARMERGRMPKSIECLLVWYLPLARDEVPERLHKAELWHDTVSIGERENGIAPSGGSLLGTPAWAGTMRLRLEASPSMTDEDGYYRFPIEAALSRLSRRWPFMARALRALAKNGGDWRSLATAMSFPDEVMEVFVREALIRLWNGYHEQVVRAA